MQAMATHLLNWGRSTGSQVPMLLFLTWSQIVLPVAVTVPLSLNRKWQACLKADWLQPTVHVHWHRLFRRVCDQGKPKGTETIWMSLHMSGKRSSAYWDGQFSRNRLFYPSSEVIYCSSWTYLWDLQWQWNNLRWSRKPVYRMASCSYVQNITELKEGIKTHKV